MHALSIFDASTALVEFPLTVVNTFPADALEAETETSATRVETAEASPKNKKKHTVEPYTVTEDGRFIGQDNFEVPRSFVEFFTLFPNYVNGWVKKRLPNTASAEREDRVQELLLYLMALPEDSMHREPGARGFAEGCTDRIQTFNPEVVGGASRARFLIYVDRLLMNQFCSLYKRASSNPVTRPGTMGLHSKSAYGDEINDDFIYTVSQSYRAASDKSDHSEETETRVFVNAYLAFVAEHNPELVSVAIAIAERDTFVEAYRHLGMTEKLFMRARNRLGVLHACYIYGQNPPHQRKVYRERRPSAPRLSSASMRTAELV